MFAHLVFSGEALKLYIPSLHALLLSKIYPMLDRPEEGKDLQDIEDLIKAGVVSRAEIEAALTTFENDIRYETDGEIMKASWVLVKILKQFISDSFSILRIEE